MFVLHIQFNILSWIFGTLLFDVVPIRKNQYLFTSFFVSSP